MQIVRTRWQQLSKLYRSAWGRRLIVGGGGLLAVFVLINLVLGAVFWHRTYPNSRVGRQVVGSVSYNALTRKVAALPLLPTSVILQQANQNIKLTPRDLGIQVDSPRIASQGRKRAWLPLQNLFSRHDTPVYTAVNHAVLVQKLTTVAGQAEQASSNAHIILQNNQFVLADAVNGSQVDITGAVTAITRGIGQGRTVIKLPMTAIAPTVSAASLQSNLRQLQAGQAVSLSYTYNNKTSKPSAVDITSWYAQSGDSYSLQTGKIQTYINQLGTADGIRVQNLAQAVSATEQALQTAKTLAFTLVAVPPGVCANNALSQVVVVSISQQHMWACEGYNQVYDTAITSGAYLAGTPTPTGTWHIYAKQRNLVLRGPTWNDPVSYWLPFYTDYGFHDASWQTFPFGDPAYADQGSHGCVHLPTPAMAWLYGWSHVGTAVTISA